MEATQIIHLMSSILLMSSGYYYGFKFLQRNNILLWFEWWVIGISATNMFMYLVSGMEVFGYVTYLLDAFSRSLGIPLIALLGMLKAVNGFEPSKLADALLFLVTGVLAIIIIEVPSVRAIAPYFFLMAFFLYAAFLCWLSLLLWRHNKKGMSYILSLSVGSSVFIAVTYDFMPVQYNEENIFFNFITLSQTIWAFSFAVTYYAYEALLRIRERGEVVYSSILSNA